MNSAMTTSTNGKSWEIVPINTLTGIVLTVLFFYLFFRHFLFVFMFMDVIIGWLRKFNWFPKEGKRRKTIIHGVVFRISGSSWISRLVRVHTQIAEFGHGTESFDI